MSTARALAQLAAGKTLAKAYGEPCDVTSLSLLKRRFVETAALWLSKLSSPPTKYLRAVRERCSSLNEYSEHILRSYHRTALSPGSWASEYASGQTTNRLTTAVKPKPTG